MTDPGPESGFTLSYELEIGDLRDQYAAMQSRRRQRVRRTYVAVIWGLIAAVLGAFLVAVHFTSASSHASDAPGWLYLFDAAIWVLICIQLRMIWQLNPRRLAKRAWNMAVTPQGRHRDEVGPGGITWTSADGSQARFPWSTVGSYIETERAFHLLDHRGRMRNTLPKRGLPDQDLIPALRTFLEQAIEHSNSVVPDAGAKQ